MTARASLATASVIERGQVVSTRVDRLRSQAPLVLRPVRAQRFEPLLHQAHGPARVALASAAAGPLGGDELALHIHVGAASTLLLSEVSATLLLPGVHGGRSRMHIEIDVDDDATLVWLPEPVIAAQGCDHVHDIRIDLATSARLFMRDELLLGRHREASGDVLQNVRVCRHGRPLLHQQLCFGPRAHGASSPAVLGRHKCVATVLAVDPVWTQQPPQANQLDADAALLPLAGPAAMISALAADTPTLRRRVHQGINMLGAPWCAPLDVDAAARQAPPDAQRAHVT